MGLYRRIMRWWNERRRRKKEAFRERVRERSRKRREKWRYAIFEMQNAALVDSWFTRWPHPICWQGHDPEILDGVPTCILCGDWVPGWPISPEAAYARADRQQEGDG